MAKNKEEAAPKYGIEDFANLRNVTPASARVQLRKAGVKLASNGRYGWDNQGDMKAAADKCEASAGKKEKKEKAPAKKAKTKAKAKKSSRKSEVAEATA